MRLDEEARSIQEMIRKSEHRDSISFETRWAVRPSKIFSKQLMRLIQMLYILADMALILENLY